MLYLTLDPYAVLHGQIWRIFTWVIVPPSSLDPFTIILINFLHVHLFAFCAAVYYNVLECHDMSAFFYQF